MTEAFFAEILRAEDVKEGDYLIGTDYGPSWPLEAKMVTKNCWSGHSRTKRRIETFHRCRVVDKDTLLVAVRRGH